MLSEVRAMGNSFEHVTDAVDPQGRTSAEALSALRTLKKTAESVHRGSSEIQKRSSLIYDAVERLKGISKQVNNPILDAQKRGKESWRS
jgi:hypothetical protein